MIDIFQTKFSIQEFICKQNYAQSDVCNQKKKQVYSVHRDVILHNAFDRDHFIIICLSHT